MKFFNIDEALKLPQIFNVMHNALDELYAKRDEEFQKSNPLKEIYKMVPLNTFQKSFGSSTGFKQAFEQTVDYASYPGFTNGDGFRTVVSYKPFNGKVVFTWQTLMEADPSGISETLKDYQVAWQRQLVQYGMYALVAFFGNKIYDPVAKTHLKIVSADTRTGDPMDEVHNPVFYHEHTIVKQEGMSAQDIEDAYQSNKYYIPVKLDGTDPLAYAKIADGLNQIKVAMNKLKDDNNQYAGLRGRKKIVATEDARLNGALRSILAADNFSDTVGKPTLNLVKDGFDTYFTPYLEGNPDQPIPQFATTADGYAKGLLMLDPEYNNANKGPMMVERLGFSMKAVKTDDPEGIKYLGKQAFDFFCPSWRGVAYIFIGTEEELNTIYAGGADSKNAWANPATFTPITPVAFASAVQVVNKAENPVITDEKE
jgi:hypothetical protein